MDLLFQIIPMMMPVIMGGDDSIKERFGEDDYNEKIEAMFRNKMLDNLEVNKQLAQQLLLLPPPTNQSLSGRNSDEWIGQPSRFVCSVTFSTHTFEVLPCNKTKGGL